MYYPKKRKKIIAVFMAAIIAAIAFAGCTQLTDEKQESSVLSAPVSTVSEVTQEESSDMEISEAENSVEEKSTEESKSENSVAEKSESESSAESSDKEKSKENSEVESSLVESYAELSEAESSLQEISKEESRIAELSEEESSVVESSNTVSIKDAIRYGRVNTYCPAYDLDDLSSIDKETIFKPDSLVAISSINDETAYNGFFMFETYEILYSKKRYVVCKDDVDIFPDDYVPDFSDEHWVGID